MQDLHIRRLPHPGERPMRHGQMAGPSTGKVLEFSAGLGATITRISLFFKIMFGRLQDIHIADDSVKRGRHFVQEYSVTSTMVGGGSSCCLGIIFSGLRTSPVLAATEKANLLRLRLS